MKRVIYLGRHTSGEGGDLEEDAVKAALEKFNGYVAENDSAPIVFCFGDCSGGGINAILDFAELIAQSTVPTVALVLGKTHSAAVFLVLSCRTRIAFSCATFILHPLQLALKISVAELEPGGKLPKAIRHHIGHANRRMAQILKGRTKMSREDVARILSLRGKTSDYSSKKALEVGIVDEIIPYPKSGI